MMIALELPRFNELIENVVSHKSSHLTSRGKVWFQTLVPLGEIR